jgi:hypothetical protein
MLVPALLLEAAVFGATEDVVVERYVFYAAPLLAIGFLVAAREQLLRGRLHLLVGAALAVVAFALPSEGFFDVNVDQSPVFFGLRPLESALGWPGQALVITLLVLLALAAAALGRRQRHTMLAAIGATLLVVTSAAASAVVVTKAQRTLVPEFGLTSATTLVIFPAEKSSDVVIVLPTLVPPGNLAFSKMTPENPPMTSGQSLYVSLKCTTAVCASGVSMLEIWS